MTERKAKRRLKNFDFSSEGAHLALVHKEQGGAANGYETLVMKSAKNFSDEFVQKMQQVRITMELDDFLETFFNLWEDDAAVLAAMMGYKEEPEGEGEPAGTYQDESFYEWYRDKCEKMGMLGEYGNCPEPTSADHQEWIAMRLEGIEVIKSLRESDSVAETLSNLTEDQYLGMLRDQERFEKALSRKESVIAEKSAEKQPVVAEQKKPKARIVSKAQKEGHKAEATDAVVKQAVVAVEANPAVEADSKKVQKMTVKTVEVEKTDTVEMVEKSQFEMIQKALDEQKEELQKARDLLAQFEKEKKEAIAKARKETLVAAVEKEEEAEKLFKAVGALEAEAFDAVVEVVKALAAKVEADPMFKEQGKPTEGEQVQKSALRAKLEAKYKK